MLKEDVDKELKRLQDALDAKRKIVIEKMGNKWILHPDNHVKKKENLKPNTLG